MKKSIVIIAIAALVITVSVGAYAHYEGSGYRGRGMRGSQRGMMSGSRSGMDGPGWMHGTDSAGGRGRGSGYCGYYGEYGNRNMVRPQWNAPGQPQAAPQMITEDKVKEIAETYISQYLPGYTVDNIAKDSWRPMYFVTIKGENNAEMQMLVHGFGGQVMHVVPTPVEKPVE